MLSKRRENGFNLAFLDVMACGLGAVLLILIIVNFNDDTQIPSDEIEKLDQELSANQAQTQIVNQSISQQAAQMAQQQANANSDAQKVATLSIQQQDLNQAIADKKAVISELEDALAAMAPLKSDDPLSLPDVKEERYLLGLVVEGKRIGILFDTSASMTDVAVIDIIKRKLSSDKQKQAGPKWQRALRVLKWMLARVPKGSEVSVVSYNNAAKVLGPKASIQASVSNSMDTLLNDINSLVPQNGTNLNEALMTINQTMPDMTDLYIITDGLPSLINVASGFSPKRNCNPLPKGQSTITGACRIDVMQRTLAVNKMAGVRTNIVLLPLEGDPQAPALYWQWAHFTGGTFISPAGSWP